MPATKYLALLYGVGATTFVHTWHSAHRKWTDGAIAEAEALYAMTVAALLACAALLDHRTRRIGLLALAACSIFRSLAGLPGTYNHLVLESLTLGLLALFDPENPRERNAAVHTTATLAVLVLAWSGLQKALHGAWFHGEYLTYMIANDDRFRVIGPLLSHAELARIAAAEATQSYRSSHLPTLLLSNLVWLGELSCAALLAWPPARKLGVIAAFILLVGIEVVARELVFGVMMLNLILCFWPDSNGRPALAWRLLPLTLLVLVAIRVTPWLAPDWFVN